MDRQRFKDLLDKEHAWPCSYKFKFIVERQHLDALLAHFPGEQPQVRPSAKERFVGVTLELPMADSDSVLAVYDRVRDVPSLMAL